jgi:Dolichyl-phosphate-mannose-protein mannosyltransferase
VSAVRAASRPSPQPPPWDARRDGAALAALVLAAVAIQLPLWNRWLSFLDEGAIAEIAREIANGKTLYRDAVHVALPGVFYLLAGLFELFGPSFLVGRYVMVVAFTTLVALVYVLARQVSGRAAAGGATLIAIAYKLWAFPHWQMLSYTPLALLLVTVAVALLAADVGRRRRGRVALAGLLAGLAITFKQDMGGLAVVGLGVFLLLDGEGGRLGRALAFGVAAAIPPAAAFAAFAAMGLGGEMFAQTVVFPLVGLPGWEARFPGAPHPYMAFPPLWPPFAADDAIRKHGFFAYFPSLLLDLHWKALFNARLFRETVLPELFVRGVYVMPYAVLAVLAGRELWRRLRRPEESARPDVRRLRLLLVMAAALLAGFNRPRDWIHLMVLYPPTIVLLAPLVETVAGAGGRLRRRLVLAVAGVAVAAALAVSIALGLEARAFYAWPIPSPRAGVLADRDAAATLGPLLAALAPVPGEPPAPLAALPYQPTLNFLTGRPLATRFLTVLPLEEFPDRQDQILADLARDPRTEIVYGLQHLSSIRRPQYYAPRLFAALTDHWRLGQVYSGTRFDGQVYARLEPRPPVHETVVYDFAEHLDAATLREVEPDGATRPVADVPRIDMWPFERPVVSVVPSIAPTVRRLAWTVDVPEGTRLRFGAGMNPDEWTHFLPAALHFVVRLDGAVVWEGGVDPRRRFEDRHWLWGDVAVEAGRGRTIALEVSTDNGYGTVANLAGWARPRLVRAGD